MLGTVQNFLLGEVVLFGKSACKKRIPPPRSLRKILVPPPWKPHQKRVPPLAKGPPPPLREILNSPLEKKKSVDYLAALKMYVSTTVREAGVDHLVVNLNQ